MGFKDNFNEESRSHESDKIILKYPTRLPVIVEKQENCLLIKFLNRINQNPCHHQILP